MDNVADDDDVDAKDEDCERKEKQFLDSDNKEIKKDERRENDWIHSVKRKYRWW